MSLRTVAAAVAACSLVTVCAATAGAEEAGATPGSTSLATSTALQCPAHPPKVENGKLMVWDDTQSAYGEYFVKGMAYSPEASSFRWGNDGAADGPEGSLCRRSGDLGGFTLPSCFDSDYFGTLVSLDRSRTANGDFRASWLRDLDAMKAMGVNTVRLYNADPQFRDHKQFLDDAQARGMKVMMPAWYLTWNADNHPFARGTSTPNALAIQDGVDKQLAEIAGHPAILMWTVGNELVSSTSYDHLDARDQARVGKINAVMAQIKAECGGQLLVTNVPQDLGDKAASWDSYARAFPKQDLFVVNSGYRTHPKNGGYKVLFDTVKGVTAKYDKPLVIGEAGEYDGDHLGDDWFEALVGEIKADGAAAKVIGATFFEYSDEPQAKSNFGKNPSSKEQHMGVVQLQANGHDAKLDIAAPRQARFDMVKRAFAR